MAGDPFSHRPYAIGLGCARLGSLLGPTSESSVALVKEALDLGVAYFDTANIYGQGESERILGQVIGDRRDVVICTKIGKYLSPLRRALMPLRSVIKATAAASANVSKSIKKERSKPMPTCWEPAYLRRSIDGSLKRLGRESVDVMMLHSPSAGALRKGDAIGALEAAYKSGKIRMIGASVDDVAAAEAALEDDRIRILQVPLHPEATAFDDVLTRAHSQDVLIIAREILGGPNAVSALRPEDVAQRLRAVRALPEVTVPLVGTTKINHLRSAVRALSEGA